MSTVRRAYKNKLDPTPVQVQQLEETLWRCRTLYNTALEQRITLWKQRGVTLTRYEQEAELKDLRAAFPDYTAIHSHVLQDVLARLDRAYQAFFQRIREGRIGKTSKKWDFPASRAVRAIAITASRLRSMATGYGWTTVSWSCPS